jgi:hypothetical protein
VPPKKPPAEKPIVLPPARLRRSPSIAPDALPIDETHPEIARAMPSVAGQIMDAYDLSDIADILAMIDER